MSLKKSLLETFKGMSFSLSDAYEKFSSHYPKEQIRARIYESLGIAFKRIGRGVYFANSEAESVALIEGDGRDLSILKDGSVDCIITDHPWADTKSNKGGNRSFADYEAFRYTVEDFKEKARVLKDGCFLVEFLPAENESNFNYLYEIKKMAEEAGFLYYSKVAWKKGTFVSNTGRKSKNTEDVMIFTKGKCRAMRPDVKKTLQILLPSIICRGQLKCCRPALMFSHLRRKKGFIRRKSQWDLWNSFSNCLLLKEK